MHEFEKKFICRPQIDWTTGFFVHQLTVRLFLVLVEKERNVPSSAQGTSTEQASTAGKHAHDRLDVDKKLQGYKNYTL